MRSRIGRALGFAAVLLVMLPAVVMAQERGEAVPMPELTIGDLTTIAGLSVIAAIVIEAVLRAIRLTADSQDRFGPIIALAISVGIGVLGTLANGGDASIVQGVINGILVAGGSMLTHDTAKAAVG